MITWRRAVADSRRDRPFRPPTGTRSSPPVVLTFAMLLLAALLGLAVTPAASAHHRPGHGGGSSGGGGDGAVSGSWTRTGSPINHWGAGSGTLMADGRVLFAGAGPAGTNAEIYDPATGTWKATTSMPKLRSGNVIIGLRDGRVLIANGDDYTFGTSNQAWLFDPATETWSETGSTLAIRRVAIGARLNDGRVLVVGYPNGADFGDPFAEVYDPATGTWSATGPMLSPRTPDTATTLIDGRVLVTGDDLHNPELYDPVSNSWSPAGSLRTARSGHRVARLADGRALVAGGYADRFRPAETTLASVEIYDPAANAWTTAAPMIAARTFGHSATTLADGRVLVAGGSDDRLPLGDRILDGAELYNPATNTWTATRPMTVDRMGHFPALLRTGKVFVAGGADDAEIRTGTGIAGSTAELFTP
jgi:hypothetical protein